jgi:hypothetical protein
MVVKGGRHKLVGMVALGQFYKDAKQIETGKPSENCNKIGVDVQFFSDKINSLSTLHH